MMTTRLRDLKTPASEDRANAAYVQLGALVASMPDFSMRTEKGEVPDETLQWMATAAAIAGNMGVQGGSEAMTLRQMTGQLIVRQGISSVGQHIRAILFRCLAQAQQDAPSAAASTGAFIPTGSSFDALAALHRIFQEADRSILLVDPYMDESALTNFGVLAKEGVSIALLTDEKGVRPGLEPMAKAWIEQHGEARTLKVRVAPARALHDRVVLVDGDKAWILTQSLKDFAARSPAAIQKVDAQLASMKFDAYSEIWNSSRVLAETP